MLCLPLMDLLVAGLCLLYSVNEAFETLAATIVLQICAQSSIWTCMWYSVDTARLSLLFICNLTLYSIINRGSFTAKSFECCLKFCSVHTELNKRRPVELASKERTRRSSQWVYFLIVFAHIFFSNNSICYFSGGSHSEFNKGTIYSFSSVLNKTDDSNISPLPWNKPACDNKRI